MSNTPPLHNPYLDAFNAVDGGEHRRNYDRVIMSRDQMVKTYAWAIPNDEAIYAIAALSPIVEVGAGSGYWASMLRQAGALVRAYDMPSTVQTHYTFDVRHSPISPAGPAITAHHPSATLLLVWPPMGTTYDYIALDEHRRAGGHKVVYVGEGDGGCTGSKEFHRLLHLCYERTSTISIPQWYGIRDYVEIYERKH